MFFTRALFTHRLHTLRLFTHTRSTHILLTRGLFTPRFSPRDFSPTDFFMHSLVTLFTHIRFTQGLFIQRLFFHRLFTHRLFTRKLFALRLSGILTFIFSYFHHILYRQKFLLHSDCASIHGPLPLPSSPHIFITPFQSFLISPKKCKKTLTEPTQESHLLLCYHPFPKLADFTSRADRSSLKSPTGNGPRE